LRPGISDMQRHTHTYTTADNNASTLLAGPCYHRVAIRFAAQTGTHSVNSRPLANLNDGDRVALSVPAVEYTIERNGDIVRNAWYGWSSGAGSQITITETLIDPDHVDSIDLWSHISVEAVPLTLPSQE
jgi:hypothetical protein